LANTLPQIRNKLKNPTTTALTRTMTGSTKIQTGHCWQIIIYRPGYRRATAYTWLFSAWLSWAGSAPFLRSGKQL